MLATVQLQVSLLEEASLTTSELLQIYSKHLRSLDANCQSRIIMVRCVFSQKRLHVRALRRKSHDPALGAPCQPIERKSDTMSLRKKSKGPE